MTYLPPLSIRFDQVSLPGYYPFSVYSSVHFPVGQHIQHYSELIAVCSSLFLSWDIMLRVDSFVQGIKEERGRRRREKERRCRTKGGGGLGWKDEKDPRILTPLPAPQDILLRTYSHPPTPSILLVWLGDHHTSVRILFFSLFYIFFYLTSIKQPTTQGDAIDGERRMSPF